MKLRKQLISKRNENPDSTELHSVPTKISSTEQYSFNKTFFSSFTFIGIFVRIQTIFQ